jgi:hypothetical protein
MEWKKTAETFQSSWDKVRDAVEYVVKWDWSIGRGPPLGPSA